MTRDQNIQQLLAQITLPEQVNIRAWQITDYSSVCDLALAEDWTTLRDRPEDGMTAWQQSWPALVATHNERVIGFLRALTDGAITLYIADFLVAPAWRGKHIGIAFLMVCHLLYPKVRFDLLSTDHAESFYQSQDFRPFQGFRKSYF